MRLKLLFNIKSFDPSFRRSTASSGIIPDDAVDRRKLGSELLILNSSFRPHSNFYIVIERFINISTGIHSSEDFNISFERAQNILSRKKNCHNISKKKKI